MGEEPDCDGRFSRRHAQTLIRLLALLLVAAPVQGATTLITGARVFDGTGAPARVRDVLIRDDRIVAVATTLKAPPHSVIADARGLTLLPGLHDLHIHMADATLASGQALERGYAPYLAAGVTTVVNFSVGPDEVPILRRLSPEMRLPKVLLALRLGVPGGHGTESARTRSITTLVTNPAQVHAAMPRLLAQRPDLFKVFADGWRYGDPARPDRASMDLPTLSAIVADAHRARRKVVTHTVSLTGLRIAVAAGVDAVVHGTGDAPIDAATIRRMRARGIGYVATMVVYEPQQTRRLGLRDLAMLSPAAQAREAAQAARPPTPVANWDAQRWSVLQGNLRRLHRAGVRIGIGTDSGIEGVYHGWATLREIETFTRVGFSPRQALAAATSVSATIIGQHNHGRIAPGQRADLLLTGGRPDVRIADLYDTRRVFAGGVEVPLAAERKMREQEPVQPDGGE